MSRDEGGGARGADGVGIPVFGLVSVMLDLKWGPLELCFGGPVMLLEMWWTVTVVTKIFEELYGWAVNIEERDTVERDQS